MGLRVGPRPHHLSDFCLGHLVLPKGDIVDKETSAELVSDASCDEGPPCDTENHIERDCQGTYSAELIVAAEMVDCGASNCHRGEEQAERNVSRVLLLLLRQEILVGLMLQLGALGHSTFTDHFSK